jgi:hypothetical protein
MAHFRRLGLAKTAVISDLTVPDDLMTNTQYRRHMYAYLSSGRGSRRSGTCLNRQLMGAARDALASSLRGS